MEQKNKIKILLTGGGTLGSVSPLLSVAERIRERCEEEKKEVEFLWIGSWSGPERKLVESEGIRFERITSGKLRRYASPRNLWTGFFLLHGLFMSLNKIRKFRPDIILSAGSYVAVPVVWAGWLWRVPSLIHQQDYRPGLANKLSAPFAKKITVALEKSIKNFSKEKVEWVGNPVRHEILSGDQERAGEIFRLEKDLPTVLVVGGGTGALKINELMAKAAPELTTFCQIIHVTGSGRNVQDSFKRYHVYQFLVEELKDAYAVCDIVISRCGLGTMSELCRLKKPVILVPMPNTHQEENVKPFIEKKAAVVLSQKGLTHEKLIENIKDLLGNKEKQKSLAENIGLVIKPGASKRIADLVFELLS